MNDVGDSRDAAQAAGLDLAGWDGPSRMTLTSPSGHAVLLTWSKPKDRRRPGLRLGVDHAGLPFHMAAEWRGPVLLRLEFEARDETGITERQVQRTGLATLLRAYRQMVIDMSDFRLQPDLQSKTQRRIREAEDVVVRATRTGVTEDAGQRQRGRRVRGAERDALLRRVATEYRQAVDDKRWPVIAHVAGRIAYSEEHTRELVRAARKAGHLAPARRGVAGEQEPGADG